MSVNYDRVCRLCLSSRGELLPIFPTTSSDDSEPPVLASKIKDCVSVEITENDDLPSNVCRKCVDNVHNWHIFKSVCERTQNKLQALIKKDGSQLEEVNVKNEPLSDEAYDDGVVIDGSYPDAENAPSSSKLQPEGPPILASLGLTPRSDKTYVDPRKDWHRVHAILDMIQEDAVIDSLQSTEEMEIVCQSDHNSDSETDQLTDIDELYVDSKDDDGYLMKNNLKLAKKSSHNRNVLRTEVKTLRKSVDNLKRNSFRYCPNPISAWSLFFTEDLLQMMLVSTNNKIIENYTQATNVIDIHELRVFIGILYLHGIMRPTYPKCRNMWNNKFGITIVKNAMKYDRFEFILKNLSFDTADESKINVLKMDAMKRIRNLFEQFAKNCRSTFQVGNAAVVDEIIVPVYGPCPFRYKFEKKTIKDGLKLILVVDPSNFYVSNLDVITDNSFGPEPIIDKLVQHLAGTGRTIIMDSWFGSLDTMKKIKIEYKLFSLFAMHPDNNMIPPFFISKYRKCKSVLSAFVDADTALTSYVNINSKVVNVLSNDPTLSLYNVGYNAALKYMKEHSVVEVLDVLMHYYTTMQNTNNWTLSLFFTLLNIAAVNAQVVWGSQNSSNIVKRRSFIRQLAVELMMTAKKTRQEEALLQTVKSKTNVKMKEQRQLLSNIRKSCEMCTSSFRKRTTKRRCLKCNRPACVFHAKYICNLCIS